MRVKIRPKKKLYSNACNPKRCLFTRINDLTCTNGQRFVLCCDLGSSYCIIITSNMFQCDRFEDIAQSQQKHNAHRLHQSQLCAALVSALARVLCSINYLMLNYNAARLACVCVCVRANVQHQSFVLHNCVWMNYIQRYNQLIKL